MSEEIIKILDELGKRFGLVIDWSSQNIIPYLKELMSRFIGYRNAQAIMWILISLIVIAVGIIVIIRLIKWTKSDNFDTWGDDEFMVAVVLMLIIPMILIFIVILFCNIEGLLQNIFMPELTVIDYIKDFQK